MKNLLKKITKFDVFYWTISSPIWIPTAIVAYIETSRFINQIIKYLN